MTRSATDNRRTGRACRPQSATFVTALKRDAASPRPAVFEAGAVRGMSVALLATALLGTSAFVNSAEAAPEHNCAAYASAAVAQNEHNIAAGCGFTGNGWQSNYDAHFTWCQQQNVGIQALSGEDHARKVALQQCGEKTAFCNSYAGEAVSAQIENMKLQCNFGGSGWQANHGAHFSWCMNVQQSSAAKETANRADALSQCKTVQIDPGVNLKPVKE